MLLLKRRAGEEILIDRGRIQVKVIYEHHGEVMIGINAPADVDIYHKEAFLRKKALSQRTKSVVNQATPVNLEGMPL